MITLITILHVFVCVFLILVVLLQAGRGGGMGAAFGGSSQTVFGGAGAGNFLTRLTVIMAALFMLLSATLAYLSSGSDKALENAAKAIQMREDARKLDAKDKAKEGAPAEAPASTSETPPAAPGTEAPTTEGANEAAPAAEGAPAPEGAEAPQQQAAPPTPPPSAPPAEAPAAP